MGDRAQEIRDLPWYRDPVEGESVYVRSSFYIDHGEDDFAGGEATISRVWPKDCPNSFNSLFITISARPAVRYNWYALMENQPQLEQEYAGRRAHPDPDYA